MATTKNAPTPASTTTRKANKDRPAKPEFAVIEDNLHYSPDGVKDIVISIDPEWGKVEPILSSADDDAAQGEIFQAILNVLYGETGARELIRGLKTSQFFKLAYRFMDEFGKRMGVDAPGE